MAVRVLNERIIEGNKKYVEISCLSTDTKPVSDLVTGSILNCVDNGKVYFFNEEGTSGSEWVEQFSFKG